MKAFILIFLFTFMLFLFYKLYKKRITFSNKNNDLSKTTKFNENGEEIITKKEFILLLRQDVVNLTNIVKDIVEKDDDDKILYDNLIKALKILDQDEVEKISDMYISEIKELVNKVENYYNL